MHFPALGTWIKEAYFLSADRIDTRLLLPFVPVAASTGQTKIAFNGLSACAFGQNMIDFHTDDHNFCGLAVFTESLSALCDQLAQACGDVGQLGPRVQVEADVFSPLLKQDECLRTQEHVLIHEFNEMIEFLFFGFSECFPFIFLTQFVQALYFQR